MRNINIHLTKNSKGAIFSKIIMWYQKSEYSHCAVEFKLDKLDLDVIYHSSLSSGVNFYNKDLFLEKNQLVKTYKLSIPDESYNSIMKELIKNCGKKYAILQNIGIVFVNFLQNMGIMLNNPFTSGQNCSELVFLVLLEIYPNISDKYNRNTIRPDHIEEILNEISI